MAARISIIAAIARHHKNGSEFVLANRRRSGSGNGTKPMHAVKKVIGVRNVLPWNIPEDLRNFKRLTLGHPVIMGRKTFDSIGKPLPERHNIVISRNAALLHIDGCEIVDSLEAAIRAAQARNPDEIFIIGGAQIYAQAMKLAHRLYLTEIDGGTKGDAFFPQFSRKEWTEQKRDSHGDAPLLGAASIRFDFVVYERTCADAAD